VFGAALLTPDGFVGAMLHMVNHGLAKITLFFCAGAIYATAHFTEIGQLKGLAKRMPWTCAAFTIGSLSLVGVPGFSGFIGKLFLAQGALDAGQTVYTFILIGASLFTAAYLFPIIRAFYFEAAPHPEVVTSPPHTPHSGPSVSEGSEARYALRIPLIATAFLVVAFGLAPFLVNAQYDLASMTAARIFASPDSAGEAP
jgi:multicomponent Na+:H+ antiporter subunit D